MHINVARPFELALSAAFLRKFSPMAGEVGFAGGALVKAWLVGGQPITAEIHAAPDGLDCCLTSPSPIAARSAAILADRVGEFLSTRDELGEFHALAAADPPFAPLATRLRGFHHPKFPTPFEALCWALINQRIQLARARALKAMLVRRFGAADCDAFPEAATLAAVSERDIVATLGDERRGRALADAARRFATVDEAWLRAGPLGEVEAWLRAIWGAGDFTVGLVLYRGLGRSLPPPLGLPWSEKFVAAARTTYGPTTTRSFLVDKARHYGRWVGYWSLYLYCIGMGIGSHASPRPSPSLSG
jgi:DNA-3-methyladenine glycosylase II